LYRTLQVTILDGEHYQADATCVCQTCEQPTTQCHADILIMMDSSVCHAGYRWELIRKWTSGLANQFKIDLDIPD